MRRLQQPHFYKNYKIDSLQTKSYLSPFFSCHCCDDWANQLHAINDWYIGFKLLFLPFLSLLHSFSTMGHFLSFYFLYTNIYYVCNDFLLTLMSFPSCISISPRLLLLVSWTALKYSSLILLWLSPSTSGCCRLQDLMYLSSMAFPILLILLQFNP